MGKNEDEIIVGARMCTNYSEAGFEAIELLKGAGIEVSTAPVEAMDDPEIHIDYPKKSLHLIGLGELKQFLSTLKHS